MLQFVVDHVQRRSTDGELTWELPPAVDQTLVAAGLKAKVGPWTLATARHRVAVLSTAHRLKQVANPCEQPAIRTVLSRAARAAVNGPIMAKVWRHSIGAPASLARIRT